MTKEVFDAVSTGLWRDSTLDYQANYINPRLAWTNSEIYTELLILVDTLREIQSGTLAIKVAIEQSSPWYHHDANICGAKFGYYEIPHGPRGSPVIEGNDGVPVGLSTTIPGWGSIGYIGYSTFTCPKQTDTPPLSQNVQYYLVQPCITLPLDRQFLPHGYRALPGHHSARQSGMESSPSLTASVFRTRAENAFAPSTTQQQPSLTHAYERQHNAGIAQSEHHPGDRSA